MKTYRIGISENIVGNWWYQLQIRRFGCWWDSRTFRSKKEALRYCEHLEKCGNYVEYYF